MCVCVRGGGGAYVCACVRAHTGEDPHSEHRFLAPSLKEGCRKAVLGVCVGGGGGEGGTLYNFCVLSTPPAAVNLKELIDSSVPRPSVLYSCILSYLARVRVIQPGVCLSA